MAFVPNPTLALGLNGITDGGSQRAFLDLMKQARPWRADMPGEDLEYAALLSGGYLDANGWPTSLPPGANNIQTIWTFSDNLDGTTPGAEGPWVLTYEGSGTLNVNWVTVTSTSAGRIEFTNTGGGTFWMSIKETDPEDTGDYIRNIRIVPAKYEALADAGEIFNPDWLEKVRDARTIRFMDWMETNWSPQINWADRPKPNDFSYAGGATRTLCGAPVEVMVALANKIGANPWFNMPHRATDDYVEQFATYVRDNLEPALVANVEYSNETWNFGFGNRPNEGKVGQFNFLAHMAGNDWGRLQGVTTDGAGYAVGATSITLAAGGSGGALSPKDHISIAAGFHPYDVATGLADVSAGGTITLTSGLEVAIPASATPVVENLRGDRWVQYSAKRAVQVALLWNGIYGYTGKGNARLRHHIGVQQGWQGLAETQLDAAFWESEEPGEFIAPKTVIDDIAITTYFGGQHPVQNGFGASISIASPSVVTKNGDHNLAVGDKFRIYSDNTLPTGVTSGGTYYVKTTPTPDTFTYSETLGGPAVNTSGTQSGSHQICASLRLELIEEIEANPDDVESVYDWLTDRLLNRADIYGSVPQVKTAYASFRIVADSHGMGLSCYEGGSHEHHLANVSMSTAEQVILTGFYAGYSYSPQIAQVYEGVWEAWAAVCDSAFIQFTDVSHASQWGSWGMLRTLTDSNARADKLYELNATYPAWGEMTGGDHFLPQVVDKLDDGETAEFNIRGGIYIGGGTNALLADRPLSEFALSRDEDGHLHVGDLELRDFKGSLSFPAEA